MVSLSLYILLNSETFPVYYGNFIPMPGEIRGNLLKIKNY